MHHHRQFELQAIIKTLQCKVHALQQQLTQIQHQQQENKGEHIHKDQRIIEEKDKTIKLLMEEVQKARADSQHAQTTRIAQMENFHQHQSNHKMTLDRSKDQLEAKAHQQATHYEQKLTEKEQQRLQLSEKLQQSQRERKALLQQIKKLNRFYVQSLHRQPQREQTLLWVDKLIQFISKTNQIITNQSKQREQVLLAITLHITHELKQLNLEYSKNDTIISNERIKFLQEMQNIVFKVEKDYQETLKSNNDFSENFLKIKQKEQKEIIHKLQQQLDNLETQKTKQLNDLRETLENTQKEKQSLLVNIQQLKSYYQLREKANKEEIDFLKQTMEDLLKSQDVRETEFQKQITRMGQQIEHLTVKFYEKLELPINAVYNKIKEEVNKFKKYFEGFFSDSNLQKQIQRFQLSIVQYLTQLNEHKEERQLIKETAKEAQKILSFLNENHPFIESEITQIIEPFSGISFHSSPIETQNSKKLSYELATARRQIEKLKEHSKINDSKSPTHRGSIAMTNAKMLQISSENEVLKERIQKLQRQQRDKFNFDGKILAQSRIGRINTAILERLQQKMEDLLHFADHEQTYITSLSHCVRSLNQIIINPVQTFQQLLNEIKSISALAAMPSLQHPQIEKMPSFAQMASRRQVFKQIIWRKQQSGNNIVRSSVQLTKIVRELLGKHKAEKQSKNTETVQEVQKVKQYETRGMLQKRMKEVHAQKLKIRQEMLQRLMILQEKMRTMEVRSAKKHSFPFIKFEESICKKLQQMFASLSQKQKVKGVDKVVKDALADARSKLKESHLQNQGLVKQIEMLRQVRLPK